MKRWFKTVSSTLLASGLAALACTGESQSTFDQVLGDMVKAGSASASAQPNPAPVPNPDRPAAGGDINTATPGRPVTPPPDASVDAAPDAAVAVDAAPDTAVVPDASVGTVGLHIFMPTSPFVSTDAGPDVFALYVMRVMAYRYPGGVQTAVPVVSSMQSFSAPDSSVADVGVIPTDTQVLEVYGAILDSTQSLVVYFDVTLFGALGSVGLATADLSVRNTSSTADYQSIGLGTLSSTGDNSQLFHTVALTPSTDYAAIRAVSPNTLSTSVYPYSSFQSFPSTAGTLQIAVY